MGKDTVNIYEVLEILNEKINNNNTKILSESKKLKTQLDETKIYLLENINKQIDSIKKSIATKLEVYKKDTDLLLSSKQEKLVSGEFKKLKTDINKDLEDLANRVLNARII